MHDSLRLDRLSSALSTTLFVLGRAGRLLVATAMAGAGICTAVLRATRRDPSRQGIATLYADRMSDRSRDDEVARALRLMRERSSCLL